MFSFIFSIAGWGIIPDLATRQILHFLHRQAASRLGFAPPQLGTPAYRKHYTVVFSIVVLGYLLYTLVQNSLSMKPNFYEVLGVSPLVDENGLKAAFRQFAKKNHPDRPDVGPKGEELFMLVRDAFESLKDPVKRFAYDRFGPDAVTWKDCTTPREYLQRGLLQSSGYHIAIGTGLLFWSAIGQPSPVSFWRFMLYIIAFALEVALLVGSAPATSRSASFFTSTGTFTNPAIFMTYSNFLHWIFPTRVIYQNILFLHQVFIFFSVALSRVAPLLFQDTRIPPAVYDNMQKIARLLDREASLMLHTQLHSIHPQPDPSSSNQNPADRASLSRMRPIQHFSPTIAETLSQEMEELIIETNIKQEIGPLRSAWEAALRKLGRKRKPKSTPSKKPKTPKTPKTPRNFWENAPSEDEESNDGGQMDYNQGISNGNGTHIGGVTPTRPMLAPFPGSRGFPPHFHYPGAQPHGPSQLESSPGRSYVRGRSVSFS